MGKPDLKTVSGDSPHTRCANCETVFEVSPVLLSSADTRVRCGECLSIFDALVNLCSLPAELSLVGGTAAVEARSPNDASGDGFDNEDFYGTRAAVRPASGPAANPSDSAAAAHADSEPNPELGHNDLDATYADFDLFSGDAELPDVAYFEQTSDVPGLDVDDAEPDHDETFSDTLFVRDAAIEIEDSSEQAVDRNVSFDDIEQIEEENEPREDLVFKYRDADDKSLKGRAKRSRGQDQGEVLDGVVAAEGFLSSAGATDAGSKGSRSPWAFRFLLGLSLTLLLSALFTYRHRDDLHNNPTIRPLLLGVCSLVGCNVPSRVAIDELKLLKRSVKSHPEIDDALTIELAFRNTADFDQRYPTLVIRLSDTVGSLVARRDFSPDDYIEGWVETDTLDTGERIDVTLEIRDPGANAMSFELDFQAY